MFRVHRIALAALITFPLVAFLAGCGENPTGPNSLNGNASDKEILSSLVTSDPTYADYFTPDGTFGAPQSSAEFGGLLSGTNGSPFNWYRALATMTHQTTIQVNGQTADVVLTNTMNGQLVINDSSQLSGPDAMHTKPLVDVSTRYATFEKAGEGLSLGASDWKLVSISPAQIVSDVNGNPPTVQIQSVLIEPDGSDPVTITDPSQQLTRKQMLVVTPGQEVTIIVSHNDVNALAFLHGTARRGDVRFRMPFEAQNDGTFKATFHAPRMAGVYTATVDLLTKGSLEEMDPAVAPYDSNQWGFLFRVSSAVMNGPVPYYENSGS